MKKRRHQQPKNLGATGRFPDGQFADADDHGEIRIAIGHDAKSKQVVLDFGDPVTWMAFSPEKSRELAESLMQHAYECEQPTKE
tara:strand:+ start:180 stop:431 length:252 start_codon:yes stop_codon:yes gene_type:complete